MKLRDFKRCARQHPVRAVIISDGCRDYVVEVHQRNGAGSLTDRRGRVLRFSSLTDAKHAVRQASTIELAVRVAADEACAGDSMTDSGFATVALQSKAA